MLETSYVFTEEISSHFQNVAVSNVKCVSTEESEDDTVTFFGCWVSFPFRMKNRIEDRDIGIESFFIYAF